MTTTSYICDKWIPINLDMKDKVTVILQEISNRYKDPDQVRMYMKKRPR